ncbi:MAG: hypothetical protein AAB658_01205, partial [Chloroflexota bacterium]
MGPEDLRKILIEPGRLIGLIGDYNAPSTWTHDEQVQVTLTKYVVAQRRHRIGIEAEDIWWDTAAIAIFPAPFETTGIDPEGEKFIVSELLLFLRYPEVSWDDDRVVFVYGVKHNELLDEVPLLLTAWEPKVRWLSAAAVLTLEDIPNLSEYSRAIH